MAGFGLSLVGWYWIAQCRFFGVVLGDNDRMREALEANYRPPGKAVGGGLLLNGDRGRGREPSPIRKGGSYESKRVN